MSSSLRIVENFEHIDDSVPKPGAVLANIRDVQLFHQNYGARHPAAAYNTSLQMVGLRLFSLLKTHNDVLATQPFLDPKNTNWQHDLLERTDHVLDSLMEHLEDCGGIIRSFFETTGDPVYRKIFGDYKRAVEPYRSHIGKIDNFIKHNQGRLRVVCFSWIDGACLGYFVEGPHPSGGLGPTPVIHPDGKTAFSFNRDIPFHICNVFAIGARLATALHQVDKQLIAGPRPKSNHPTDWSNALRLAAQLPRTFFPDEVGKAAPILRTHGNKLTIDSAATRPKVSPPPSGEISVSYRGDGITQTFHLPYMN